MVRPIHVEAVKNLRAKEANLGDQFDRTSKDLRVADSVLAKLIDAHRLAKNREKKARHRPKGYTPPVPLEPLKAGATAAERRAFVSKHMPRYRKAVSDLAAALKVAAQTNDELAALSALQGSLPEPVSAWPELDANRLDVWLDRADTITGKG